MSRSMPRSMQTPLRQTASPISTAQLPFSRGSPGKNNNTTNRSAKPPSTPKGPGSSDSPGNWRHPRLDDITKRRSANTFNGDNVRTLLYNGLALGALYLSWNARGSTKFRKLAKGTSVAPIYPYVHLFVLLLEFFLCYHIVRALLPLVRKPDTIDDIPLTPSQRKLLGLPPAKTPATPGTVYSTPPRYSRTPSVSGSVSGSPASAANATTYSATPRSYASSPIANSPLFQRTRPRGAAGTTTGTTGTGSPNSLYQSPVADFGSAVSASAAVARRRSSFGSPTPATGAAASSLFSDSPLQSTPSPSSGKRMSMGLNNKWLYEKGRRSSGSGRIY